MFDLIVYFVLIWFAVALFEGILLLIMFGLWPEQFVHVVRYIMNNRR